MTANGYKNRILSYASANGHNISGPRAMKLAIQLCKRQARMTDLDLERIFTHSDPTPKKAFRNIEDAERHAA